MQSTDSKRQVPHLSQTDNSSVLVWVICLHRVEQDNVAPQCGTHQYCCGCVYAMRFDDNFQDVKAVLYS